MTQKIRQVKAPGFRILVRMKPTEAKREEVSKGGIVLEMRSKHDLELEQQGMTEGYVIDIGPSAFKESKEPWCRVGDCVLIYKHSGTLLDKMGDEFSYRIVQDLDIQAVFPEERIDL